MNESRSKKRRIEEEIVRVKNFLNEIKTEETGNHIRVDILQRYCFEDLKKISSSRFDHEFRTTRHRTILSRDDFFKFVFGNDYTKMYVRWTFRSIVRKKFKKKDLAELLRRYVHENDRVPTIYERQIELAYALVHGKESELKMWKEKRDIEKSNIRELSLQEQLFIELCGIQIPDDVTFIIFEYVEKTRKNLNSIGVLSERFYVLFLRSWEKIFVKKENVFKFPILVLNSVKKLKMDDTFIHRIVFKKDMPYLHNNLLSVRKITCKSYFGLSFFTSLKIVMRNCTTLSIFNLAYVRIKRKFFPNVRLFKFSGWFGKNGNKIPEITKETLEFLQSVSEISCTSVCCIPIMQLKKVKTTKLQKIGIKYHPQRDVGGFRSESNLEIVGCFSSLKSLKLNVDDCTPLEEVHVKSFVRTLRKCNNISSVVLECSVKSVNSHNVFDSIDCFRRMETENLRNIQFLINRSMEMKIKRKYCHYYRRDRQKERSWGNRKAKEYETRLAPVYALREKSLRCSKFKRIKWSKRLGTFSITNWKHSFTFVRVENKNL